MNTCHIYIYVYIIDTYERHPRCNTHVTQPKNLHSTQHFNTCFLSVLPLPLHFSAAMGQSPCSCDRGPAVNTQTITGDDGDKASVTETTGNATYEGAWLDGQKHGHGVLIGTLENVKKTLYFCCFPPTYRFLVVFF